MATTHTISYQNPTNLKDVRGLSHNITFASHYSGASVELSHWNNISGTNNDACMRIKHTSHRNTSPTDGYLNVNLRVQTGFGPVYFETIFPDIFVEGYTMGRPLFTSSNPLIFSGDESGQYTMELLGIFKNGPDGSGGPAYGQTHLSVDVLYN
jgi:hypothetical protein